MSDFCYVGQELDLFARAVRWKAYFRSRITKFIQGDVLEVGAGIGGTTSLLIEHHLRSWTALEPDASLAERLRNGLESRDWSSKVEVRVGTTSALPAEARFDTILYVDVLEHIERDREEMEVAAKLLRSGGHVVMVSPAHMSLYTAFDAAIGHHRRYDRASCRALTPPELTLVSLEYLDSLGLFLSLGNRLLLRSSMPNQAQISFWDRWVIPCSRVTDRILFRRVGKTILGVWRRA